MEAPMTLPRSMQRLIDEMHERLAAQPKLAHMFAQCFANTYQTTIQRMQDGTTFVITGDIPAMWLRDSTAQVRPYLLLAADDGEIADLVAGLVRRQMQYILHDAYANAFNAAANGNRYHADLTETSDLVWERKYEVDSLCYPLQLAYLLWKATGRTDHFDANFQRSVERILAVWTIEQQHEAHSPYRFQRIGSVASDTLVREGKGALVAETGMTWSGFRPSDDACTYGYLVPSNMFAVVVLGYVAEIAASVLSNPGLAEQASRLRSSIDAGIQAFARVEHPNYGTIYAYETDGFGHHNLMDDANIPSLLALPYLGYCAVDDPIYRNTRRFILSSDNPYFYTGKAARGVGSPHTPFGYIWHISLALQGLTATDEQERTELLHLLAATDAGTNLMHEGFSADDPAQFTRPWFSWANAMFCELALFCYGISVPGSPLGSAT